MSKRSLKASEEGAKISRRAFDRRGWTQEYLAAEVNLKTRQPIWRFFTGKPIERHTFMEICEVLNLNWWEIADQPPDFYLTPELDDESASDHAKANTNGRKDANLNELTQYVRSQHWEKIWVQCGELRIFNISRILNLSDLYVDMNLIERDKKLRGLSESLAQGNDGASGEMVLKHLLCSYANDRVSYPQIFENYSRIRLLGKPGSGKTTLLQHMALQCIQGRSLEAYIPVFITLEKLSKFAEKHDRFDLFNYVCREFQPYELETNQIELLLHQGRFIFLLDGLDEIGDRQSQTTIIKEINYFSEDFYRNLFVVTCRSGAQTVQLSKFVDFEVVDLTLMQVEEYVKKWFAHASHHSNEDWSEQARNFMHRLNLPEHWQIRDVVQSPLMLSSVCQAFQRNQNIFSSKHDLYQACLNVLLIQWDRVWGIHRHTSTMFSIPISHELSLLSQLASDMLQQGRYFFTRPEIDNYIKQYIEQYVSDADKRLDSESFLLKQIAILESMIAHHGLLVEHTPGMYSFSNTAFQEHLALRQRYIPKALSRS
jgi:predicted NACHT family NTPase